MKTAFYSLVLTVFVILPVRADLTIVYSTTVQPASHNQKVEPTPTAVAAGSNMTIKVKGDKARIDVSPQVTAIFDGQTGELINLLNDQKTIVRVAPDKMRAIADMLKDSQPLARGKRSTVTRPSNIHTKDPILRQPIGLHPITRTAPPSWRNFSRLNPSFGMRLIRKCLTFAISPACQSGCA